METDLEKFIKCDIFTPDNISEIMASKLKKSGNLLEPSVGSGNLLKYIDFDDYNSIDIYELKNEYMNKIKNKSNLHKYNCDFIKEDISVLYDNIIMNPPYIKMQDLSILYRNFLKETFNILKVGIIDIYYAFIIKCLRLLKDDGIMVAITPNSYLYNKSSLKLRKYLFDNKFVKEIIDFNDKKVFKKASVYCCITIFTKSNKEHIIYNDKQILYTDIVKNYSLFNLTNNDSVKLKSICKIKNGIATLRDKIYIHNEKLYDEPCWKKITNGNTDRYIIYPYSNGNIIKEDLFKENNPLTYEYLLSNQEELSKRDKGKKKYPMWYSYGRTQSIKYNEKKCIYIPCFCDPEKLEDNIFIKENILHSSCLCIIPNNEEDIQKIINCLINNIEFIKQNSSKRSGGWISMSSRILYQIPLQ